MPRLYRPHVPLEVRYCVALRQTDGLSPGRAAEEAKKARKARSLRWALDQELTILAKKLGCRETDLRLDHDPPLAARPRYRRGLGKKTYYEPPANDADYLLYRPHGPEFAGSHLIKTYVRGEHGQYPDRVLIKRERKRREGKRAKPKRKWSSPPLRSASRWPPKRSRKIGKVI
jgi:hypothetical protein